MLNLFNPLIKQVSCANCIRPHRLSKSVVNEVTNYVVLRLIQETTETDTQKAGHHRSFLGTSLIESLANPKYASKEKKSIL